MLYHSTYTQHSATRHWHVTISCQPDGHPPQSLEEWTRTFSRGQQCSKAYSQPWHRRRAVATAQARVMEVSQGCGVCAWSCCHLANGNKTCPRLFTHVISFFRTIWRVDLSGLYDTVHQTWHTSRATLYA